MIKRQRSRTMNTHLTALALAGLMTTLAPVQVLGTTGPWFITTDTTLTEDHFGEITIAVDRVTLDCDGYYIVGQGNGTGTGIGLNGKTEVTVKYGNIMGFDNAFTAFNCTSITLIGNTATANVEGFVLGSCDNCLLRDNSAENNDTNGIVLVDVPGGDPPTNNTLETNSACGNAYGFILQGANGNTLTDNVAQHNGHGFLAMHSDNNLLTDNMANNNDGPGFQVGNSSGNAFMGNIANDNGTVGFDIFFVSEDNIFNNNSGCGNIIDAWDLSTGSGNIWLVNDFCSTQGILSSDPVQAIQDLILVVTALNAQNGIINGGDAKLESAINALDDVNTNNDQASCNQLDAFIHAVQAQSGSQILNLEEAQMLIDEADRIKALIGCQED